MIIVVGKIHLKKHRLDVQFDNLNVKRELVSFLFEIVAWQQKIDLTALMLLTPNRRKVSPLVERKVPPMVCCAVLSVLLCASQIGNAAECRFKEGDLVRVNILGMTDIPSVVMVYPTTDHAICSFKSLPEAIKSDRVESAEDIIRVGHNTSGGVECNTSFDHVKLSFQSEFVAIPWRDKSGMNAHPRGRSDAQPHHYHWRSVPGECSMATTITTQPITLDEYDRMQEAGALLGGDPIELLDGALVEKMTKLPPRCAADDGCGEELRRIVPAGWYVGAGQPIRIPEYSEPEPDQSVVRGTRRDYAARHPEPSDVAIVIEISDSSLAQDRGRKLRIYANAGIPIYWIINLMESQFEVYSKPGQGAYGSHVDFLPGQRVPVIIDGNPVGEIAVYDILPHGGRP